MIARLVFWGSVLNRMSGWRMSKINRFLYRVTGGRLGGWIPGVRLLLLTTTGRRSGCKRIVPVAYWREGELGPSEREAFWRANDSPLARLIASRTPRTIPFFRLSRA